ncbi:Serine hydrolase-like protein 2 [Halocaridina rubra]|uniref:Serine hydrolase-like protein 2 n=1 Tax=Halocaridina rubra TaxID=373956 RepID=A0AAN8X9W2_HALRR
MLAGDFCVGLAILSMAAKALSWHDVSVHVGWGYLRGKTGVVGGSQYDTVHKLSVVCIHGWFDCCNSFDALVPLLPKGTKVLVLDLPGHGHSDHLPLGAQYNLVVYAANVQNAIAKLGWNRFVLMGHSMGVNVSVIFTALFPQYVRALVCLDQVAPYDTCNIFIKLKTDLLNFMEAEKNASRPPLVFSEEEAINRLVSARFRDYYHGVHIEREAIKILLPRLVRYENGVCTWRHDRRARPTFTMFMHGKIWRELIEAITCPVLVIQATGWSGKHPKEKYEETFNTYRKRAQWLETETVKGGHHIHLGKPQRIAPIISRFLEKVAREKYEHAKL